MFTELTISAVIFSFLVYLIWRLNREKKQPRATLLSTSSINHQRKLSPQQANGDTESEGSPFEANDFITVEKLNELSLIQSSEEGIKDPTIEMICFNFKKPHPLLLPLTQTAFEPNELFELIKTDPQITAKILKRVNSPAFGLLKPITSIHHAIIYLGVGTVKNIALHYALDSNQAFENDKQELAYQKLLNASYLASSLTLMMAKELRLEEAAELSTSCLLSYLGDMALLASDERFSTLFLTPMTLIERIECYQSRLSLNQQVVGSALVRHWQLPRALVRYIDNCISPITNSVAEIKSSQERIKISLIYLSSRIADVAILEKRSTMEQVLSSIAQQGDLHVLFSTGTTSESAKLLQLLNTPSITNKANQLINLFD